MLWFECHRLCDASAQDLLQTFKSFPEEQWCRFCWFPHLLSGCITRTSRRFFSKILATTQICSEISDFSTARVRIVMTSFFSRRLIDTGQDIIPGCSVCADDYSLFCVSAHVLDWMDSGWSANYLLTEFSRQIETNLRSPRNKLVLPVASPALPGTEIYSPPVPLRSPKQHFTLNLQFTVIFKAAAYTPLI